MFFFPINIFSELKLNSKGKNISDRLKKVITKGKLEND